MNKNKSVSRRITVAEMAPHIHKFTYGENKVNKLTQWMIDWIRKSLKSGIVKPYDYLPPKTDLACHIGVSLGTMQNVFRSLEDCGIVESKQRIGTYIAPPDTVKSEKLTSKRELAVEKIKKHILENKYKVGEPLISTRNLAKITEMSPATIRNALNTLVLEKIIKKRGKIFIISNIDLSIEELFSKTLAEKIAQRLKVLIESELKTGDKLPPNNQLAKCMSVSVKTIHDALKYLAKEGLIETKRGKYGTIVTNNNAKRSLYDYEKVEHKIKDYIIKTSQIGTKLPSIKEFASMYKVSSKTVKKALDNMFQDGYITFTRGRYGGTFVTDMPQHASEAYTWLALNQNYINNTNN